MYYNTNMEKDLKMERQKFQMHQKGYENIVEAIKCIKPTDMSETNILLKELIGKLSEIIIKNE